MSQVRRTACVRQRQQKREGERHGRKLNAGDQGLCRRHRFFERNMYILKTEPEFLNFKEPKHLFQVINSARLCSPAGRYDNPIPTRFLAPTDCLKIPALGDGSQLPPLRPHSLQFARVQIFNDDLCLSLLRLVPPMVREEMFK